jgi:hypothetical protein
MKKFNGNLFFGRFKHEYVKYASFKLSKKQKEPISLSRLTLLISAKNKQNESLFIKTLNRKFSI